MDRIEIPVASAIGKLVVIACCVLIVWAVLWWWPKFTIFLNTVSGRTLRNPETKNIHMILGFIVYAIILAPAVIVHWCGHCHHGADSHLFDGSNGHDVRL
jgi:hypothetical protein